MLRGIIDDLRFAIRSLRATPAVTMATALTLTLGIGATTAIFSVANGLALRPLPVKDSHELVTITSETALRFGFQAGAGWNYAMWEQLRQRAAEFDGAFAWTLQRLDLSDGGELQPVNAFVASAEVFQVLGVPAAIGRTFTPADDETGGPVVVISHSLWQRRFGGRPDVLGSRLLIERVPVTIVGVAPAWFRGIDVGQPFEVAIPFGTDRLVRGQRSLITNQRSFTLTVILRLKPAQRTSEATATLRAIQPHIVGPNAPEFLKEPFTLVDASRGISDRSQLRQQYWHPLVLLSIISGIVAVIVCLNVANVLLSRASARRAELSIRLSLGASRWQVARYHLAEALLLGIVGTAGGMLLAAWASRALLTLPFPDGAISLDLAIDGRVFAFAVGVGMVAVMLFGTMPSVYATRVAPIEALQSASRGGSRRGTSFVSSGLVVVQLSLSVVLLAGAGLFVSTVSRLVSVPLGFDPHGMLVVSLNTGRTSVKPADIASLHQGVLDAVMAVPGVTRAAGSVWTPVGTGGGGLLTDARGRRPDARQIAFNFVSPGWFNTYGTPITMGRDVDTRDGSSATRVALVNETLRRRVLSESEPLGATIHAGPCGRDGCTVIGVVADAVYGHSLRDAAPPTLYMPLAQSAGLAPPNAPFRLSIRAAGDPTAVMTQVAARLRRVDPEVSFTFRRLQQDIDASVAQERLLATLAAFFGGLALLLSGIGLYGVSSHAATRRRAEIGIRLALGGPPHLVARAMMSRIALSIGLGVSGGGVAAWWLSRFVAPLVYGLAPHDPITLVAAASILGMVAAVAGWIPVSRAMRVDPAQVLRSI